MRAVQRQNCVQSSPLPPPPPPPIKKQSCSWSWRLFVIGVTLYSWVIEKLFLLLLLLQICCHQSGKDKNYFCCCRVLSEEGTKTQTFETLASTFHGYFDKKDFFKIGSSIVSCCWWPLVCNILAFCRIGNLQAYCKESVLRIKNNILAWLSFTSFILRDNDDGDNL